MKRLQLPKNKFLRLLINVVLNVVLIFAWYSIYSFITWELMLSGNDFVLQDKLGYEIYWISNFLFAFLPMFFITRFIWFKKSRNRTFYGLFNKFKFPILEPRIYTTTSNADELKKYSDLKDQGIITEEEFQAKKKKLLDL